jgi:PmbA protein
MELEAAVSRAVEAALAGGAGAAEAYAQHAAGREIRIHGGEVESLTAATERGLGVRAWIGGRVGYSYGTELSDRGLAAIAERAVTAAAVADEDEFAAPPAPAGEVPVLDGIDDPSIAEWPEARVVELALAVERAALEEDARIAGVEQAVYADSRESVAIASSTGIAGTYTASTAFAYLQALAGGDGAKETGLGFGLARSPAALDAAEIGREGAQRALAMIGARKPSSRACPVVFDPTVAASFLGFIASVLGADAVQRGRSPFAERLGDEVASEALLLYDDGTEPEGLQSAPFDDEGLPRRRISLVEEGRLRTFLHDSYTARRGGAESTASAGRGGYRSPPSVSPSNLIVSEGELPLEELLRLAGDGIYIDDVAGLHSGVNPVSGVFSVGASGREISGGELAGPMREFTIASDLVEMLRGVRSVGAEARWVPFGGSVRTPPLLVGEMAVSGT